MPPKKRPRVSKRAADSGKQIKSQGDNSRLSCCIVTSGGRCFNNSGKAADGETVSSAKEAAGGKRKATKEDTESDGPPQYSHWLMKSEPESRLENGIDVKVRSSVALTSTVCC